MNEQKSDLQISIFFFKLKEKFPEKQKFQNLFL